MYSRDTFQGSQIVSCSYCLCQACTCTPQGISDHFWAIEIENQYFEITDQYYYTNLINNTKCNECRENMQQFQINMSLNDEGESNETNKLNVKLNDDISRTEIENLINDEDIPEVKCYNPFIDTSNLMSISDSDCSSVSSNSFIVNTGKDNILRILCLNCCGLKTRLQYPEFNKLIQSYDIVCLVETKTDDIDIITSPGYTFHMKNRKKVSNKRSGGIIVGHKNNLEDYIEILTTKSKYVLWFKY